MRMSGTEFYRTIQDMKGLKGIYALAQKKVFDIYEMGTRARKGFIVFCVFFITASCRLIWPGVYWE